MQPLPLVSRREIACPHAASSGVAARYRFDTVLARGTVAVILWLGVITGVVVLVSGTLLPVLDIVVHGKRVRVVEGIWQNLLRTVGSRARVVLWLVSRPSPGGRCLRGSAASSERALRGHRGR